MQKGNKMQNEMESSRASAGKVREPKHVDLYKLPAGQEAKGNGSAAHGGKNKDSKLEQV